MTGKISLFVVGLVCLTSVAERSYGTGAVDIEPPILRNRVVVLDRVVMRKALYVAFSLAPGAARARLHVEGRLLNNNAVVSRTSLSLSRERTGNLVFDLPYDMRDGLYTISVDARDDDGTRVASGSTTVRRSDLRSDAADSRTASTAALEELPSPRERDEIDWTEPEKSRGYIVFTRSPLAFIYPGSRPERREVPRQLSAQAVRNASATLTFALQALHPLGKVKITMSDLRADGRKISRGRVRVACVESVPETTGMPQGRFRNMPTLLVPVTSAGVSECRRVWITIMVGEDTEPGIYSGTATIAPEHGTTTSLPVRLSVTPVSLEDVPGVDYCMLMTYEFAELTMPWGAEQKKQLYTAATRILKDYREHGMTTLCLHSPFVLITGKDGTPRLDDIFAALRAAHDAGFTRPVIWYMGHLIQTAKPRHPGNIRQFDASVHIPRLRYLATTVSKYAQGNGFPQVVFLPIDEPDDSNQDFENRRGSITPLLVETLRESGAKSMVTGQRYVQSGRPDYLASATMNPDELDAAHAGGARYWRYENRVATDCANPAYARYQYGYYTWKNKIDGMSTWTFQNTQNAAGPPGRLNTPGRDVYLAYPAATRPLSTLRWEAIRAGIDDHRLIYQLVKRVNRMKAGGQDTKPYEDLLKAIGAQDFERCCDADSCPDADLSAFDRFRDALISMILRADREMRNPVPPTSGPRSDSRPFATSSVPGNRRPWDP